MNDYNPTTLANRVADALANWVGDGVDQTDREISRRVVDRFGTTLVIVRSEKGLYRLYRGFVVGEEGAEVSVDLDYVSVGELLDHLLERYKL